MAHAEIGKRSVVTVTTDRLQVIWIEKRRIPPGNWPFLNTARNGLEQIDSELEADIDLTEGNSGVTITGCMRAYRQSVMRRALDLAQSSVITWNGGNLIGSIVCARGLLETIATHHSFLKRAEAFAEKSMWKEIGELVDAYAFSTSTGPNKPTKTEFTPPRIGIAVKDFIAQSQPGQQEFWDQICDTAHPNGEKMMKFGGVLKDKHYLKREASENEAYFFPAIFNTLYSCCWLTASDLDFEILLAVIRNGEPLPTDHPLIQERQLVDEVAMKLSKELGPMKPGVSPAKTGPEP